MRVLITGAAGFIGSHLCSRFLSEGHEVIGVDNFVTGSRENVEPYADNPRFTMIEQDASLPIKITGPLDWAMHFACPASPPKYLAYPVETLRISSEGTYHLLELAKRKGAQFFLASTSEVYGDPEVHPQPETYWGKVNPIGERSVYDEGKRYAEAITSAYHRYFALPTRIIRIFNTYGPRMHPEDGRVVTNFIVRALRKEPLVLYGDGSQTRSFQYVDDLVEGIRRLMAIPHYAPVNLGNPDEYTIRRFAEVVRELVPGAGPLVHGPLPADDPKQRKPDISVAKRLLDWHPRVPLRDGIRATVEYFVPRLTKDALRANAVAAASSSPMSS
jgi:dTDP-glucose 4,6-dehydratase